MSIQLSEAHTAEMKRALEAGNKIEAIKVYRAATGCDLVTAKTAVETLIGQLVVHDPQKYARLSAGAGAGKGCLVAAVVLAALSVGVSLLLMMG